MAYDDYMAYLSKEKGILESAIEEGIAKGEQIGIEKGRIAGKIETAKNLHAMGLKDEDIALVTDMSIEEIQKL